MTPDEIAAYLLDKKAFGEIHPARCPLANHFKRLVNYCKDVEVSTRNVTVSLIMCRKIKTPHSVILFINRFDTGQYPELNWNGKRFTS